MSLGTLKADKLNAGRMIFHDEAGKVSFNPIHSRIQEESARGRNWGCCSVVQGGRVVWEEGFGWVNREAGVKATSPHTPFSLASITKLLSTAATMMTLAAEGNTSLVRARNKYLAGCQLCRNRLPNAEVVKCRCSVSQLSALPGFGCSAERKRTVRLVPQYQDVFPTYGRLA